MQLNIIIGFDREALNAVERLVSLLSQISKKETLLMSTLDEDIAAIAAQTTAIGSLTTFITGLEAQIAALPGLTPAQQAAIDKIFTDVNANNAAIAAAMVVNVPPPPPGPVAVPVPPVA